MIVELDQPFNLEHTFLCGQAFRWRFDDGFWSGISKGKIMRIRSLEFSKKKTKLEFITAPKKDDEEMVRWYLRLDDDLPKILKSIDKDALIHAAIEKYYGLHLVRQEPFEALISYLFSAQSSIPVISRQVERLSETYGKKVELDGYVRYSFPTPREVNGISEEELLAMGLGFRAKWVVNAVNEVNSGRLKFEPLFKMAYLDARARLMELLGVGPKIADCTLLFSLDKLEAFPTDRWIRRVMQEEYFGGENVSDKKIIEFAMKYFGRYAGYAQEYLFYYRRGLGRCGESRITD